MQKPCLKPSTHSRELKDHVCSSYIAFPAPPPSKVERALSTETNRNLKGLPHDQQKSLKFCIGFCQICTRFGCNLFFREECSYEWRTLAVSIGQFCTYILKFRSSDTPSCSIVSSTHKITGNPNIRKEEAAFSPKKPSLAASASRRCCLTGQRNAEAAHTCSGLSIWE